MGWDDDRDFDREEPFVVYGVFLRSTEKAMLIRLEEDGDEVWFPYSRMSSYPIDPERGEDIDITIPMWLAVEKELAEP